MIVNDNLNVSETRFMTSKNSKIEKSRLKEIAERRLKHISAQLSKYGNCYVMKITDKDIKTIEEEVGKKVRIRTADIVGDGYVLEV